MDYYIFIYDYKKEKGKGTSLELLRDSVNSYLLRQNMEPWKALPEILREEKGKPFFKESNVCFSISHSGDKWACMVGPAPCGLDIQEDKPCDYRSLTERFFDSGALGKVIQAEEDGGENAGRREFLRLWTEREARGKFTGEGFFHKGELKGFVHEVELGKDIFCAYCTGEKGDRVELIRK